MKKNIRLMYAIVFLQGMVFYAPIATLYRRAQNVSVFEITLIESISLILCLVLEIPWGVVADRIGYKRTMIFCCCLFFVSKLVFWQATGFWWFLLERVMMSVVFAGLSGVDTSVLYLSCEKAESQKVFGLYNSLGTAGMLIASAVFAVFVRDNYKLAGALTALGYGLAALLSFGLTEVRDSESHAFNLHELKALLRQLGRDKSLLLLLFAVAFISETNQTVTVFLNQLQYEKCGLSPAAIGWVFIVVTVAGLGGALSARFTEKAGIRAAGTLLYGAAAAACLLLAFTGSAALSVGAVLLLVVANSLFQPLQTELQNRQVTTASRATALSLNAMLIDCVGAGTNLVFGSLAKTGLRLPFLFGAALCLAGMGLFLGWRRRRRAA